MPTRFSAWLFATASVTAVVTAVVSISLTRSAVGQPSQTAWLADGRPDFSGVWQANNEAHWDLQAHEARPGAVTQAGVYPYAFARVPAAPVLALGAAGGVPGSMGVVLGDGQIPYPGFPICLWYRIVRTSRRALISGAPT